MVADRNLLFGIVALQNNFVTRDQLVEAMNAWCLSRQRPLGDVLRDQSALTREKFDLLDALVSAQLKQHQGDVEKSIQSLGITSSVRQAFRDVADKDVQESLSELTVAKSAHSNSFGLADEPTGAIHRDSSRFRILRPHARGGLGEVFVAHDVELRREVALKEIQTQHADNELSRSRFIREAEVTGGLEHPNIVPVYGLGTYADGRPFYAMRFIRGDSLKEAIERFYQHSHENEAAKNLAFRNLLKRFVDVCNAIAYAHSRSILHRDLKPGNIMLGKYGETLVVDWGLAKSLGTREGKRDEHTDEQTLVPQSASGSVETMHGSAVGTPAYLSPEQAVGKLDHMGPASDVYSLGATLYVLLTGQPPFSGPVAEILRKVEKGQFVRPRELNPAVSPALEAVTLKAMALQPGDRFPSATALGQEIERFLADEPVQCFREPFVGKAKRWLRRNPGIVSSAIATVLVGLAALGTSLFLVNKEKNRTAEAHDMAVEARDEARSNFELASEARDQAFQALRTMTDEVVERKFAAGQGTRLTNEDRSFLRGVIAQYDAFATVQGNDAESRVVRADGRSRVGTMRFRLGEMKEAEQDWETALAIRKELVAEFPDRLDFRRDLAKSHGNRGNLMRALGRMKEAEMEWETALAIRKELSPEFSDRPDFRRELAGSHLSLSVVQRNLGKWKQAEEGYVAAMLINKELSVQFPTRPEFRHELARCHTNRGILMRETGRTKEAEREYNAALAIYQPLAREFPDRLEFRQELATVHNNRGNLLRGTGQSKQAEAEYDASLQIYRQLVADFPTRPEFRQEMARTHNNRGVLLFEGKRIEESEKAYASSQEIYQQLVNEFPTRPEFRQDLAMSSINRGDTMRALGRQNEAEQNIEAGLRIYKQLAADYPNQPDTRNDLAVAYLNRAVAFQLKGDWANSGKLLVEGLQHNLAALKSNPMSPFFRKVYSSTLSALARSRAGMLEKDEAVRAARMLCDVGWSPPADAYQAAISLSRCLVVVAKLPMLDEAKRKDLTDFYSEESVKLLREAMSRGYSNAEQIKKEKYLDPLRQRKDFQALMTKLEKAAPAK